MYRLDINKNIKVSQGDSIPFYFKLSDTLESGDKAILTIRQGDCIVYEKEVEAPNEDELEFVVTPDESADIDAGHYVYNLHFEFADGTKWTANYLRLLTVVNVAHEVC